ncbi:MAG: MBL fold metallo-hydrolase [Deltaproteobacteria bacterium]|nr:MBL fold metallo-hydrolase [Deltaproteobacteria bacterium]
MAEQILPDIYRIAIPLPRSPLKAVNVYVLKGEERSLIVDTGWDQDICLRAMRSGLEETGVDLDRADFFITHLHADHMGLLGKLIRKTTRVYLGATDAATALSMRNGREKRIQGLIRTYLSHGFPEPELLKAVENHPGFRFGPPLPEDLQPLREGDPIEIGRFSFRCIETPGHSPGHICLYEPNRKILISGDHILADITPNITVWPEMQDSLLKYLASLEKVCTLEVKLVLPGHRSIVNDLKGRVKALREHHGNRLDEVIRALESGEKTAWEVAPRLTWDLDVRSWDRFPPAQKWFAMGETVAHINYLVACGKVDGREHQGRWLFSLRGGHPVRNALKTRRPES